MVLVFDCNKDVPFTNGTFVAGTDAFNMLSDQGYDVDDGLYLMELLFLESQYLANLIKTTERVTVSDLVISSEADCEKIKEKGWKSITVNGGLCKSMTDDLDISFYPYLEWIRVEGSYSKYSLKNIHSLTISSKMIRNFYKSRSSSIHHIHNGNEFIP